MTDTDQTLPEPEPITTAAEHKAEAERLLAYAEMHPSESWLTLTGETKADMLAAAHVHAVLAHIPDTPGQSPYARTVAL